MKRFLNGRKIAFVYLTNFIIFQSVYCTDRPGDSIVTLNSKRVQLNKQYFETDQKMFS